MSNASQYGTGADKDERRERSGEERRDLPVDPSPVDARPADASPAGGQQDVLAQDAQKAKDAQYPHDAKHAEVRGSGEHAPAASRQDGPVGA
ncbi:MAG: hypothetical protein J5600_04930, partial [Desulfovibrio sp.]|nr:hypothetical protein [Desulfovibrio sp.]